MTEITEDTWRELEVNLPSYGLFNAKCISTKKQAFVAVNHQGNRHILLRISNIEEAVLDNRSRGLMVEGRNLIFNDSEEQPFILVGCTDKDGNKAFNLVVTDILLNIESGENSAVAVTRVLEKWRRFWGGASKQILSEEQIKGLFGELWFLLTWLMTKKVQWIEHWLGPTGSRHDFEKSGVAIEAKTTSSVRGHIHRIHGIDQLDPPQDSDLYFYSLRVRREGTATNTLPMLIRRIKSVLGEEQQLIELFEQRLAIAGYSPVHEQEYSEYKFRIIDERLYLVNEMFPRLSLSLLHDGVPNGIERIDYDINLEVCNQCLVAKHPQEFNIEFQSK